jgi:4'-phosphopantetheinyl transferase
MTSPLMLAPEQVNLWKAPLDLTAGPLDRLERTLSSEERERANRFRCEIDRARFIAARGWLRTLLAGYLNISPSELGFSTGPAGKPWLRRPLVPSLHFNLSHSAGLVVFAVARNREVGVDVEQVQDDFPIEAVADQIFSEAERQTLYWSASDLRVDTFFALWTRKEAYLKGIGVGWGAAKLAYETETWDSAALATAGQERPPASQTPWSLSGFDAGSGYAAAVAVEGSEIDVPSAAHSFPLTVA